MTPEMPVLMVREAFMVFMSACGPIMAVMLGVGFAVGVMQAATQINDPAVGFIPRVLAVVGVSWLAGPWILERLAAYFISAAEQMGRPPL